MVTIGSLNWKVAIEGAAEAKQQAKEVEEKVDAVRESMEAADEQLQDATDTFESLKKVQETVEKSLEQVGAKAESAGESVGDLTEYAVGTAAGLAAVGLLSDEMDTFSGYIQQVETRMEAVGEAARQAGGDFESLGAVREAVQGFERISQKATTFQDRITDLPAAEIEAAISGIAAEATAAAENIGETGESASFTFQQIATDAEALATNMGSLSDTDIREWFQSIATGAGSAADQLNEAHAATGQFGRASEEFTGQIGALSEYIQQTETRMQSVGEAAQQAGEQIGSVEAFNNATTGFEKLIETAERYKDSISDIPAAEVRTAVEGIAGIARQTSESFEGVNESASTAFQQIAVDAEMVAANLDALSTSAVSEWFHEIAAGAETATDQLLEARTATEQTGQASSALELVKNRLQEITQSSDETTESLGGLAAAASAFGVVQTSADATAGAIAQVNSVVHGSQTDMAALMVGLQSISRAFDAVSTQAATIHESLTAVGDAAVDTSTRFGEIATDASLGSLSDAVSRVRERIDSLSSATDSIEGITGQFEDARASLASLIGETEDVEGRFAALASVQDAVAERMRAIAAGAALAAGAILSMAGDFSETTQRLGAFIAASTGLADLRDRVAEAAGGITRLRERVAGLTDQLSALEVAQTAVQSGFQQIQGSDRFAALASSIRDASGALDALANTEWVATFTSRLSEASTALDNLSGVDRFAALASNIRDATGALDSLSSGDWFSNLTASVRETTDALDGLAGGEWFAGLAVNVRDAASALSGLSVGGVFGELAANAREATSAVGGLSGAADRLGPLAGHIDSASTSLDSLSQAATETRDKLSALTTAHEAVVSRMGMVSALAVGTAGTVLGMASSFGEAKDRLGEFAGASERLAGLRDQIAASGEHLTTLAERVGSVTDQFSILASAQATVQDGFVRMQAGGEQFAGLVSNAREATSAIEGLVGMGDRFDPLNTGIEKARAGLESFRESAADAKDRLAVFTATNAVAASQFGILASLLVATAGLALNMGSAFGEAETSLAALAASSVGFTDLRERVAEAGGATALMREQVADLTDRFSILASAQTAVQSGFERMQAGGEQFAVLASNVRDATSALTDLSGVTDRLEPLTARLGEATTRLGEFKQAAADAKDNLSSLSVAQEAVTKRLGMLSTLAVGTAGTVLGMASSFGDAKSRLGEFVNTSERLSAFREQVASSGDFLSGLTERLGGLTERFEGLDAIQEKVGKGFDEMNAKAGFFGSALAFVSGMVLSVVGALTNLSGLLLAGGLIAAVAALAAAWATNFGGIKDKTKEVISDIKSYIENFNVSDLGIREKLTALAEGIGNFFSDIGFEGLGASLEDGIKASIPAVEGAVSVITGALGALYEFAEPILSALGQAFGKLATAVGNTVVDFVGGLQTMEAEFGTFTYIKDQLAELGSFIGGVFKGRVNTLIEIGDSFVESFEASGVSLKDFHEIIVGVVDGLVAGFKTAWTVIEPIVNALSEAFKAIAGVVGRAFGEVVKWLADLESEFGVITTIIKWVTAFVAVFATIGAVVNTVGAVIGVITSLAAIIGGGLMTVLGPLISLVMTGISAFGTIIGVLQTVISVVGSVVAALNPVTLAILAIIAVAVALYAAYKTNFLGFRDIVDSAVSAVMDVLDGVVSFLEGTFGPVIDTVVGAAMGVFTDFKEAVDTAISGVTGAINDVINFFESLFGPSIQKLAALVTMHFNEIAEEVQETVDAWVGALEWAWNTIKSIVGPVVEWLVSTVRAGFDLLVSAIQTAMDLLLPIIMPIWNAIVSVVSAAIDGVMGVIKGVLDVLVPIWTAAFQNIQSVIKIVWAVIEGIVLTVVDAIGTAIQVFLNILQGDWKEAWEAIKGFFSRTWERIKGIFNTLKEEVLKIWNNSIEGLKTALSNFIDGLASTGENLINTFVGGIKDVASKPVDAIKNVLSDVRDLLPFSNAKKGPLTDLIQSGEALIESLTKGVFNAKDRVVNAVKNVLGGVRDHLPFSDAKKGPLSDLQKSGQALPEALARGIERVSDRLVTPLVDAMTSAMSAMRDVLSANLTSLVDDAMTVGRSIGQGIAEGMYAARGTVASAAETMAATVNSYLPHSPAEVGPLSDLDAVGPDLISNISTGIEQSAGVLEDSLSGVLQNARGYLPSGQGTVRDGPLRDIRQTGQEFAHTVARGSEQAAPRDINPSNVSMGQSAAPSGGGGDTTEIKIDLGGVEVGDQSLDLSNMSRTDMQDLAQLIAEILGDEVRDTIT